MKRFALIFALALTPACSLFAGPSHADLMAACVSNDRVKAQAEALGMTAEELCKKVLGDGTDAGACADGQCPMPPKP